MFKAPVEIPPSGCSRDTDKTRRHDSTSDLLLASSTSSLTPTMHLNAGTSVRGISVGAKQQVARASSLHVLEGKGIAGGGVDSWHLRTGVAILNEPIQDAESRPRRTLKREEGLERGAQGLRVAVPAASEDITAGESESGSSTHRSITKEVVHSLKKKCLVW